MVRKFICELNQRVAMIEVTRLRAAFASSMGRVASVLFTRTKFIASFISNAVEYFDHTGFNVVMIDNLKTLVDLIQAEPEFWSAAARSQPTRIACSRYQLWGDTDHSTFVLLATMGGRT
jgi:hypothetical protein